MFAEALPLLSSFQGLDDAQIGELSSWLHRMDFEHGQEIFADGSPPDGMYVLIKGRVAVVKPLTNRRLTIVELEAPSVFGEMGMVTSEPHSASVQAVTRVTAGFLPLAPFIERLNANDLTALRVASNVGRIACNRLRATTRDLLRLYQACGLETGQQSTQLSHDIAALYSHMLAGSSK